MSTDFIGVDTSVKKLPCTQVKYAGANYNSYNVEAKDAPHDAMTIEDAGVENPFTLSMKQLAVRTTSLVPTLDTDISKCSENAREVPVALVAIGHTAPVGLHTFSSQFASAGSTVFFYPLDLLRTRFMSQDGTIWRQHNDRTYSSLYRSICIIFKEEGVRTLFRGCSVAVWGSVAAWGMYMYIYRELCNITEYTTYAARTALSITGSILVSLVVNPIFLIKSRMQLEEAHKSTAYRTFRGGLVHTVKTSGIRALWRGVSPQMILTFPNALALPTYDYFKSMILYYRWTHAEPNRDLNLAEVGVCSTLSKVIILILSHPLMVLKVRLQDQRAQVGRVRYRTVPQTFLTILRLQGMKGLYRGFSTSLFHSLPRSLLHYALYEKTLNFLCKRAGVMDK